MLFANAIIIACGSERVKVLKYLGFALCMLGFSRRHFVSRFLIIFFLENGIWHLMHIVRRQFAECFRSYFLGNIRKKAAESA